jgi:hypothetical protein
VNQAAEQLLLQAQFDPATAPAPAPPVLPPAHNAGWAAPHRAAGGLDLGELWGELPSAGNAGRAPAYAGMAGMTPDELAAIFSSLDPDLDAALEFVE